MRVAAATNLFRIVQEALNNIEKHARATEARISLLEEDKLLRLEIADNGRSFSPTHAATAQKNGSLGLVSMRERAEMLGGTFEIDAQHGNGTRVRAAVPTQQKGKPQPECNVDRQLEELSAAIKLTQPSEANRGLAR